jgi:chemotaxis signal transduction protein
MAMNLRFRLQSGAHAIPLERVYRIAGFASLSGVPDEFFLGWLKFRGGQVPVFDLNRVVCDAATPEEFGSRIILVETRQNESVPCVGLLAAGVTDTCATEDADVQLLDLDLYLQMLSNFIPSPPAQQA